MHYLSNEGGASILSLTRSLQPRRTGILGFNASNLRENRCFHFHNITFSPLVLSEVETYIPFKANALLN